MSTPPQLTQESTPFPSLPALRAAHRELLQAKRDQAASPGFLDAVRTFVQRGQSTGVVIDSQDERRAAQSLLDYWANALFAAGVEIPDPALAEFESDRAPELDESLRPYPGLDIFQEADHRRFFGREALAGQMLAHLETNRLLAVSGPTGSGKTSVVLAGLLPELKAGKLKDSQTWQFLPMLEPGTTPLENLGQSLLGGSTADPSALADEAQGLRASASRLRQRLEALYPQQPVVVLIDNLKDAFTLNTAEADVKALMDNLLELVQANDRQDRVILIMRSEYEDRLARFPDFQAAYQQARLPVVALNAGELRDAILKPAEMIGLKFDDGLADELVRNLVGEPSALPLLQFTLLCLWQSRQKNRITWESYQQLGEARQALATTADQVYETMIPEDQVAARRILLRLARPGEGLEVTIHHIHLEALYRAGEAQDRVDRVLKRLVDEGLLRRIPAEDPLQVSYEIGHETLVRAWPRLGEWLEEERIALRRRLRLKSAAEQWQSLGRDEGALWRGQMLAEALEFGDLRPLEAEFVQASQEAILAVEQARERARQQEESRQREIVAEQTNRAQVQTRVTQRLRWLTGLLVFILAAALAAAGYAFVQFRLASANAQQAAEYEAQIQQALLDAETQRDRAQYEAGQEQTALAEAEAGKGVAEQAAEQARLARLEAETARAEAEAARLEAENAARLDRGRSLAAGGIANLRSDPPLGLLLALQAVEQTNQAGQAPPLEAVDALHQATRAAQASLTLYSLPLDQSAEDVRYLAGGDGRVLVAIEETGGLSTITGWNILTGRQAFRIRIAFSLSFSPPSIILLDRELRVIGLGVTRETIELHNLSNGVVISTVGQGSVLASAALSPDGRRVLLANRQNLVQVWDTATGNQVDTKVDPGNQRQIFHVYFNADGSRYATINRQGIVKIWDFPGGSLQTTLTDTLPTEAPLVTFSPDGALLAATLTGQQVGVWDTASGARRFVFPGGQQPVNQLLFSPDSSQLAIASLDGHVQLWDTQSGAELYTITSERQPVLSMVFQPETRSLVTVNALGVVKQWYTLPAANALSLPGSILAACPMNRQLATIRPGEGIRIWDSASLEQLASLPIQAASQVFAVDSGLSLAAVALDQGRVQLWDFAGGQAGRVLQGSQAPATALAFHPLEPLLAVGRQDGQVEVWQVADGQLRLNLAAHRASVTALTFSPDGLRLGTVSADGFGRLWDTRSGLAEAGLLAHQGGITSLDFSPDGQQVASVGMDGKLRVWDVRRVAMTLEIDAHRQPALAVEFSPDGRQIATASQDGSVRLWDAAAGEQLMNLSGYPSAITGLHFLPNQGQLAVATTEGVIYLEALDLQKLLDLGQALVSRPFTAEECQRYLGQAECPAPITP
jgi:WD40 repeat protein